MDNSRSLFVSAAHLLENLVVFEIEIENLHKQVNGNPDLASFHPIRRHKGLELQCSQYEPFDWSLFSCDTGDCAVATRSRSIRAASGGLHTAEQGVPGPGAEPEAGFSWAGQTCLHLRRYAVSKSPPSSQTCSLVPEKERGRPL